MDDKNFFDKETLKAISSDTRSEILNLLNNKNYTLSDISDKLKLSNSTVKEHLDILNKNGLIIKEDTERKWKYYSLTPKGKYFCNKYKAREEEKTVLALEGNYMKRNVLVGGIILLFAIGIIISIIGFGGTNTMYTSNQNDLPVYTLSRFSSDQELINALETANNNYGRNYNGIMTKGLAMEDMASTNASGGSAPGSSDYSETNIQVAGVDEADIIKTDGKYIYAIAGNDFYIIEAHPGTDAKILSINAINSNDGNTPQFYAQELFIEENRVLIFGTSSQIFYPYTKDQPEYAGSSRIMGSPEMRYNSGTTIRLLDVKDKENPTLIKTLEFEGTYISSRKIEEYVYFVINSNPHYDYLTKGDCSDILPLYREVTDLSSDLSPEPISKCTDVGYSKPLQANNFITIASLSMLDETKEIKKETILGSGQDIYASLENIYIAQTTYPNYSRGIGGLVSDENRDDTIKTTITKFNLKDGEIKFIGYGSVNGTLLNQFSMDEYNDNFRIATTIEGYSNNKDTSTNNIYILDDKLVVIGKIEGIAPSERIYSIRFMGERGYMVTFRHVDPLYVIDLSEPENPKILGQLKIPGYSDYLHPYDETHLIGIGKEVDASIDENLVHTEGAVYYTAIQGVKISIFDVSDVSNPIEMHKVVIGDRGTESLATTDHKAFLFDKEKNLLVIPITVAELSPGQANNEQGQYTFDGAYVYDISLKDGLNLRGKITHLDSNDDTLLKTGYYYSGGNLSIKRSLYIDNILYTLSNNKLKLNNLNTLEEIKTLILNKESNEPIIYYVD